MKVKVLSKEKTYFFGKAKGVVLSTTEGELEILDNHAPIFGLLKEGTIQIKSFKEKKEIFTKSGVFKFFPNNLLILLK